MGYYNPIVEQIASVTWDLSQAMREPLTVDANGKILTGAIWLTAPAGTKKRKLPGRKPLSAFRKGF